MAGAVAVPPSHLVHHHPSPTSPPSPIRTPMETPPWFSPETGIYSSKHPSISLPSSPYLDLPTHVFSYHHGGTTALVDANDGSTLSYTELRSRVRSFASGLRQAGVRPGDVVLILSPNSVLFPVVFLGTLAAGAVACPVSPLSTAQEVLGHARATRAVLAFVLPGNARKLFGADSLRVVDIPESAHFDPVVFSEFHAILFHDVTGSLPLPLPMVRQDDVAALLCSSGTTGPSKRVALTHRNLIAVVELFVRFEASQYAGENACENVYLDVVPMFHVYGLALFAAGGLFSLGSTVVVMRRFDAEGAVRAIEKYGVTHFTTVPPVLASLGRADPAGCRLSSLKQVSSGAAPISPEVLRKFLESFPHVDFIQGYGLTESTAVGTRGFNTKLKKKYMSVGLLAPNMQAKVVDWSTGSCLPPDHKGELLLRGPGIMKGYLDNEDATSSTVTKDGWLRTGDIAYFDHDGYLFIVDRLKEIIKYKGFQIAPADLEVVLISHPEVVDVAVTCALDEAAGEIPVAFVVRKAGSLLSSDDVMDYVSKQVAPFKKVRKVVFVDSIPKSPAGKVLRRLLKSFLNSRL